MNTDPDQTHHLRIEFDVDAATLATIEEFAERARRPGQEPVSVAHLAEMLVAELALTIRLAGLHKKFDQVGCRHD